MKSLKIIILILILLAFLACSKDDNDDRNKIPTPVFRPTESGFITPITVSIEVDFDDVRIFFTTDNTDPTEHSRQYIQPISITETTVFKARAYRRGYTTSDIATKTYNLNKVANPIFSLASGVFYDDQILSLRAERQDEIYYTLNGHEPSEDTGILYEDPIEIPFDDSNLVVVKAKAFRANWIPSDTVTREYEFRMARMIYIQGGSFRPTHNYTVVLSDFFISNYLVTQEEWAEIMDGNSNQISAYPSQSSEDINSPVDFISWYDAIVFCNRRSVFEGLQPVYSRAGNTNTEMWGIAPIQNDEIWNSISIDMSRNGYRLPTEMEWHFAAQGGNWGMGYRYAGSNNIDEVAWYRGNSGGTTHRVADKKPNEAHLFDMSGNVEEWVWDWYAIYLPNGTFNDPTGPENGDFRSLRGGSFLLDERSSEIGFRDSNGNPWYRGRDKGLRVVRR